MLQYMRKLASQRRDDKGASAVEYGLLVALIAAIIVVVVLALGGIVKEAFQDTCNGIQAGTRCLYDLHLLITQRST